MRRLPIEVVADNQIIGRLDHTESYYVDWEELGQNARQMAMERCPNYRTLQLHAEGIWLLDLARQDE